jgi:hypothetical protein
MKRVYYILILAAMPMLAGSLLGQTASLSGQVLNPMGEPVEADVFLLNSAGDTLATTISDCDNGGAYQFGDLATGNTYFVKVAKPDDEFLNGLSTFDMVLIVRHILGVSPFTGYSLMAADINNDGQVSILDIVRLRRLILGIDGMLTPSWRFVPTGTYTVQGSYPILLPGDVANFNFTGVKTGDINVSAIGCL